MLTKKFVCNETDILILNYMELFRWDFKGNTWSIAELLRPITISVDFQKGGKTVFKTVQFAGTVGVFTGISPVRLFIIRTFSSS